MAQQNETNFTSNILLVDEKMISPTRSDQSDQEHSTADNSNGSVVIIPSEEDSFSSIDLDSPAKEGDWRASRRASTSAISEEEKIRRERIDNAVEGSPMRKRSSTLASIPGSPLTGMNYEMNPSASAPAVVESILTSPTKLIKPKLHAIIPRKPTPADLAQAKLPRKPSVSKLSRSKPLSPIPDLEVALDASVNSFTPSQRGSETDFGPASVHFIMLNGKNSIGDLTKEAKLALSKKGLKSIPSLIGPGSLPYARCPSGIDAFLFPPEKEVDPWTYVMESAQNSPPARKRAVSVPLPGNARYSQAFNVRNGRLPAQDGSINGSNVRNDEVQRAKHWVEDDFVDQNRYDYSRTRSGTIEGVGIGRSNHYDGIDMLYQVGFGMGMEDYRAQQFDTRLQAPLPPPGFQPYIPYIPLSIPQPPPFYSVPPQLYLNPYSSPNHMNYSPPQHIHQNVSSGGNFATTPFFDPAIVSIGNSIDLEQYGTQLFNENQYETESEGDETREEEKLQNSGFYPFSPPLVRKKSRRAGFLSGSPIAPSTRKNSRGSEFEETSRAESVLGVTDSNLVGERRGSAFAGTGMRGEEGRRMSVAETGFRRRSTVDFTPGSKNPIAEAVRMPRGPPNINSPTKFINKTKNTGTPRNSGGGEKTGSIAIGGTSTTYEETVASAPPLRKTPGSKLERAGKPKN